MNKYYPSDWYWYTRYDLPISYKWRWLKQWLFQLWCYQNGSDHIGFRLLGFTFKAARDYVSKPIIKLVNSFIFSWLVKHIYLDINT